MNDVAKKIKILDTSYNKETNLVKWYIRFLEEVDGPQELTLAWHGDDLGFALGIDAKIPSKEMADFCKKIKGKEINLFMSPETKIIKQQEEKKISEKKLKDFDNILDKYPYKELADELNKEELQDEN